MKNILLWIFVIISSNSVLFSETKMYTARSIDANRLTIDGRLDESAWESAIWTSDFIQLDPVSGAKPSEKTAFTITYDNDNLYVAIRAYDSLPEMISQRATRRDGSLEADMVGVLFDSFYSFGIIQCKGVVNPFQGITLFGLQRLQLRQRQAAKGDKVFHLYPHAVSD